MREDQGSIVALTACDVLLTQRKALWLLANSANMVVETRSARVDNTTLLARVTEVQDLESKSCSNQEEILGLMRQQRKSSEEQVQKLDEVNQQLVKQDTTSRSILAVTGEALSAILQVKDLLVQVSQDVINVRVVLNSTFLRPMDPTKELPAIIEDPLGRQVPIPPEWLGSLDWEALYALLSCQLKGQNGHEMRLPTLRDGNKCAGKCHSPVSEIRLWNVVPIQELARKRRTPVLL
ncbi:hypothetical protein CEP54_005743 [Fusarium duplospermum]|uniref:Uncharacterized protein n=1 Tax=Fusarium duplospermum TaxID=1325734 RepID=A0A428QAT3_9HYPO|nr:hypothetical protein CEP54_005743 [Fusarium duplospermum]